MSNAEIAMKEANRQWYNALTSGLNLDPAKFQLTQGSISLGYDSEKIWNFLDAIPPVSLNNYYDPAGYNSFGQTYSAVINNLNPQTDDDMRYLLKDQYTEWMKYNKDPKNNPNPLPTTESGEIDYTAISVRKFQTWGISNLEKSQIEKGTTLLKQQDLVTVAMNMLSTANRKFAYTATQQMLSDAINNGLSKVVHMDSKTTSNDVSKSWASGSVAVKYGFFSGTLYADWENFSSAFRNQQTKIDATFKKVATLQAAPFSRKSGLSADLDKFFPWFSGAALKSAKDHNDNKLWKHAAPTWEDTFGPNGNLVRVISALIVADGIDITVTSTRSIETNKRDSFKTAIEAGYFPFFKAKGEGGWNHDVKFKDDGTFTIQSSSKEGNPNVIGVLVDPIEKLF